MPLVVEADVEGGGSLSAPGDLAHTPGCSSVFIHTRCTQCYAERHYKIKLNHIWVHGFTTAERPQSASFQIYAGFEAATERGNNTCSIIKLQELAS